MIVFCERLYRASQRSDEVTILHTTGLDDAGLLAPGWRGEIVPADLLACILHHLNFRLENRGPFSTTHTYIAAHQTSQNISCFNGRRRSLDMRTFSVDGSGLVALGLMGGSG